MAAARLVFSGLTMSRSKAQLILKLIDWQAPPFCDRAGAAPPSFRLEPKNGSHSKKVLAMFLV